jgi:hypothetical protein
MIQLRNGSVRKAELQWYEAHGIGRIEITIKRKRYEAIRIVFKWLNRRSQRRSKNWTRFKELLRHFQVPSPRIEGRLFIDAAACAA